MLALLAAAPAVLGTIGWRIGARLQARGGEPPLGGKIALATAATALCASLVLLGLEVRYRFAYDRTDAFSLTRTSQRWFARHYRNNAWLLRDDVEYTLRKPPGTRRITFVGDSFTVGHGVADVGDRFANRIRAEEPGWDVQVLARNGLDTGAELDALRDALARGYRSDDVVLVYCPNDLGDLMPQWRAVVDRLYDDFASAGFLVHHSYGVNHLYFRLLAWRTPQLAGYYPELVAAYAGPEWHEQTRRLAEFADLARRHGARPSAVTFPFVQMLGPDDPFAPAYGRLDALWRSLGVPHLDLRPAFAGVAPDALVVNSDDPHPNERAHALAAQAIERFLRDPGVSSFRLTTRPQ
ncbi:MAG: SGNH/GDSL hydrolase family protein [Candidatus Binatia bacterium]